jgi:hypothetical protein
LPTREALEKQADAHERPGRWRAPGSYKVASDGQASYVLCMFSVKPFRGLRFAPDRVDLGAVVGAPGDPRHVSRVLDDAPAADDGRDGPLRRARLRLADWRRAGLLRRDEQPALYAVRRREGDTESFGLFCAVGVEGFDVVEDKAREHRLEELGVAVEPVVATFQEARVRRSLENATDRDPDATWKTGDVTYELWCLDDESATARITTLLSQAPLSVTRNGEVIGAHASWWKRAAPRGDDDRARAGAFGLAFLHSADDAWPEVPMGVAFLPVTGFFDGPRE